jgi:hypothetical protein
VAEKFGFDSRRLKNYSPYGFQTISAVHPVFYAVGIGAISSKVEQSGVETYHSALQVNNGIATSPLPPYVFTARSLIS